MFFSSENLFFFSFFLFVRTCFLVMAMTSRLNLCTPPRRRQRQCNMQCFQTITAREEREDEIYIISVIYEFPSGPQITITIKYVYKVYIYTGRFIYKYYRRSTLFFSPFFPLSKDNTFRCILYIGRYGIYRYMYNSYTVDDIGQYSKKKVYEEIYDTRDC